MIIRSRVHMYMASKIHVWFSLSNIEVTRTCLRTFSTALLCSRVNSSSYVSRNINSSFWEYYCKLIQINMEQCEAQEKPADENFVEDASPYTIRETGPPVLAATDRIHSRSSDAGAGHNLDVKKDCDTTSQSEKSGKDYKAKHLSPSLNDKIKLFASESISEISEDNTRRASLSDYTDFVATTNSNKQEENEICDVSVPFQSKFDDAFKRHTKKASSKRPKRKKKTNDSQSSDQPINKMLRPNYFVAVQIHNKQVIERIKEVQDFVVERAPSLSSVQIPTPTIHLTMFVLHLKDQEDIQKACDALDKTVDKLRHLEKSSPMMIKNIGNFKHNVVFARVGGEHVPILQHIVGETQECFKEQGLEISDTEFNPHITIMKMSRDPKLRRKGIKRINREHYKQFEERIFGLQTIRGLQLCSMLKPKSETGYYHIEHQIKFVDDGFEDELLNSPSNVHNEKLFKFLEWNFYPAADSEDTSMGDKEKG